MTNYKFRNNYSCKDYPTVRQWSKKHGKYHEDTLKTLEEEFGRIGEEPKKDENENILVITVNGKIDAFRIKSDYELILQFAGKERRLVYSKDLDVNTWDRYVQCLDLFIYPGDEYRIDPRELYKDYMSRHNPLTMTDKEIVFATSLYICGISYYDEVFPELIKVWKSKKTLAEIEKALEKFVRDNIRNESWFIY